ncbi:MAG: sigma 54-interacting transcriptional regulator, partial [Myxococcales bacterium]|nr:sigma 54-interacting transcriptional regulator [Myxococcales bacterium]
MKSIPAPEGAAVLVSWVSVNAGPAPLLAALGPDSPLHGRILALYLCWRDAPGSDERAAVERSKEALDGPEMPRVIALPWKTRAKPIDHDKIRPFAEKALEQARRDNPGAHIYLHLSPGTPAMHAVWLVLGSTGFVEGPLTMIQTVREDQRSDKSPIFAVPFEVDTWLRRFRAASPRASSGDDDGKLWEPGAFSEGGRMRATLQQLRAWADLPAPVLLLGERGTGKSTLANFLRAIGPFQRGKKSEGQGWPSVVCGQFRGDPQMARSEIFGHRKGAFTG